MPGRDPAGRLARQPPHVPSHLPQLHALQDAVQRRVKLEVRRDVREVFAEPFRDGLPFRGRDRVPVRVARRTGQSGKGFEGERNGDEVAREDGVDDGQ